MLLASTLAIAWIVQPESAPPAQAACSTASCATLRVEFGASTGTGLVTTFPGGIACSYPVEPDFDDCVAQFDVGAGLEVTIYLDPGVRSYACLGQACGGLEARLEQKITLYAGGDDTVIRPTFNAALDTKVTVTGAGTGSGKVVLSGRLDCTVAGGSATGTCETHFYSAPGSPVPFAVQVDPAPGSFACVSGTCGAPDAILNPSYSANGSAITVDTAFWLAKPVVVTVSGSGTVTSSPGGIACPSSCSKFFAPGTSLRLTAVPAAGWEEGSWGGTCAGTSSESCVFGVGSRGDSVSYTFRRSATPTPPPAPTQPTGGAGSATRPPTPEPVVTPTPAPIPTMPTGGAGSATAPPPPDATPTPVPSVGPSAAPPSSEPASQSTDTSPTSFDSALLVGGIALASIAVLAIGFVVGQRRQTAA